MNNDRFKFRVWDELNKRYDYSYSLDSDGVVWNCRTVSREAIIEQCTGVKDANGTLIYEGDILRYSVPGFPPQIVAWHQKTCRWVLRIKADVDMLEATSFCDDCNRDCHYTIIGNIHDDEVR